LLQVWGGPEEDALCLQALFNYERSSSKKPKFSEIKCKEIVQLYKDVSFRHQGMWIFHFDEANVDPAFKHLGERYTAKALEGVIRISVANEVRNNSRPIYCFVGPAENEQHCLKTGQHIIDTIKYQRQACHLQFPSFVYYKLRQVSQYVYKLAF
jgi:hypothetical protein